MDRPQATRPGAGGGLAGTDAADRQRAGAGPAGLGDLRGLFRARAGAHALGGLGRVAVPGKSTQTLWAIALTKPSTNGRPA
ncbi:conserved hypothetical protein [Candidatus Defluviicoccus seviourii]|uniref:Uncharacterized protein n=1 Tax=Candidatus Defluviicoccus seviourii TaxID=2565273 RepID=A0A564WG28_9PROT|nr:conserved hypothetical protein [Candidatus Defluviicoccus seviourii]